MIGLRLTGLDWTKKNTVFGCSEAVESKPVKLETSHTVIPPPYGEYSLLNLSTISA